MNSIGKIGSILIAIGILAFNGVQAHEIDFTEIDASNCMEAEEVADFDCAASIVKEITEDQGPERGMATIDALVNNPKLNLEDQEHNLAHIVGRTHGEVSGFDGESFLACPTTHMYGCQHGFFEQVLGQHQTSGAAAKKICEGIQKEPIGRNKFFCYHGIGHGIMMAQRNHVGASLAACDALETEHVNGCYQGVFHENINAFLSDATQPNAFRRSDLLYPCSAVPKQYRWACFNKHATYLLKREGNNLREASAWCLLADAELRSSCIGEFGQMISDDRWAESLLEHHPLPTDQQGKTATIIHLCKQTPKGYWTACAEGAAVHLHNMYEDKEMKSLCSALDDPLPPTCTGNTGDEPVTHEDAATHLQKVLLHIKRFAQRFPMNLLNSQVPDTYNIELPNMVTPEMNDDADVVIIFDGTAFIPNDVSIQAGQTVAWKNESTEAFWPASDVHPTHELLPEFDSLTPLPPGSEYIFTFNEPGDWTFHDHMYPNAIGVVHVQ